LPDDDTLHLVEDAFHQRGRFGIRIGGHRIRRID